MQKFPTFEGKDLDGNTVKSDELFSANAVTVVNFWFTHLQPPGWASLLSWMHWNKELAEKGGHLSVSTPSRWTATKRQFLKQRDVPAKKLALPIRMCILAIPGRALPYPHIRFPLFLTLL